MKKYIIKYLTDTGKSRYPKSTNGSGGSYTFISDPKKSDRFYGAGVHDINYLGRIIATRIFNDAYIILEHYIDLDSIDKKRRLRYWYQGYEIVEIDEEPNWYFELWYALRRFYKIDEFSTIVPLGFKLNEANTEKYKDLKYIRVHDLELDDLNRFYKWTKKRNKPCKKDVSILDQLKEKVEYYLNKLKEKYSSRQRSIGPLGAHL